MVTSWMAAPIPNGEPTSTKLVGTQTFQGAKAVVGLGKVAVNWTTGEWGIPPLSIQLSSASAAAPLYGPWTIAVSRPLGAIVFLLNRRSCLVPKAEI